MSFAFDRRPSLSLAAALALLLFAAGTSAAQQTLPATEADRILEEVLVEDQLPSISVAMSKQGVLVYSRAIGFADLENEVPATEHSAYPIGSVSKPFTAVAALQLGEREQLDLDAPVQRYCASFSDNPNPITVRQLLGHTGGIRHYDYRRFEEDYLNKRSYESIDAALEKFVGDPLVADPGTEYAYSSWGYVLVGCAIEGASDALYADFIQTNIIGPAGLSQTGLQAISEIIPHRVRGYSKSDSGTLVNSGLFDASDRYPAGGLISTPSDLTRFADALLEGTLLGDAGRRAMWSSGALSSGEKTGRGLGWDLSEDGTAVFQGGTTVGATTYLYVRPRQRFVVAIAANLTLWSRDRNELARRLAAVFE